MQLGHVVFIYAGIESMGPSRTGWTDRTRPTPPAANSEPKIHTKAMAAWALHHTLRHRPRWELTVLPSQLSGFVARGEGKVLGKEE